MNKFKTITKEKILRYIWSNYLCEMTYGLEKNRDIGEDTLVSLLRVLYWRGGRY